MDFIDCNTIPFIHLPVVKLLSKLNKEKFVATVHEALLTSLKEYFTFYSEGRNNVVKNLYLSNLPYIYLRKSLQLPDRILAVSKITKKVLEKKFDVSNVIFSPNGINIEPGRKIRSEDADDYVTFLGRLSPEKHVDELIGAVDYLKHNGHPKVKCRILGIGPESDRLKEITIERGIQEAVTFHGYVPERDKHKLLKTSKLFVLPSRREGFCIAALEAMSHGLPVVAASPTHFECSGVFEYMRDGVNGLTYESGNTVHLAKRISFLLDDEGLRKKMSANAKQTSEHYSWDKIVKNYQQIVEG